MSKLQIKRPETTVDLCLDGSLYAEWKEAAAALDRAKQQRITDGRLVDTVTAQAEKVQALEAAMRDQLAVFTIRGLPRSDWKALEMANPPRQGVESDAKIYGFNIDAVVEAALPKSIVRVEQNGERVDFDTATDWEPLADAMTDSQYDDFATAVLQVNRGRNDLPFSLSASQEIQNSGRS